MTTYTEQEMLNLYRNALGLSRVLTLPAENERQPLDRELLNVLRNRYRTLLATEDTTLLPVEDLGAEAAVATDADGGCATVSLPPRCVRPVSLRMPEWRQPVYRFGKAGSVLHRMQQFPLLRTSPLAPMVFRCADRLMAYGISDMPVRNAGVELMCVVAPADGSFRLDESLLPAMLRR